MKKNIITAIMAAALCLNTITAVAQDFDDLPTPVVDDNGVTDNTPDSIAKALTSRPAPGSTRQGDNPVLFMVGNSTMRNGTLGNGNNGQWGWGYCFPKYFDARQITVENQALGGMSTRTFYNKLWPDIRSALRKGDWVIVSIGHNDNGPYNSGRARAVLPGVGDDSITVTIEETGERETVYSYGGYLRRYIKEIRAAGAQPILMSLTPRDAYNEDSTIVRKPHSQWAAYVAAVEGVPYVDLNELSARKLESYSHWKEQYHFFGDKIHTSLYGAEMNARSAIEGLSASLHPALAPLKRMMINTELPVYDIPLSSFLSPLSPNRKPVVFITGDSTVKNADKDEDGMWGWGALAEEVFDTTKITVINAAMAGRSTRSYIRERRWEKVYNSLRPGDFVLIEFGHNDICPVADKKARGTLPYAQDTCHVYCIDEGGGIRDESGRYEVVYSFGWYLKKMIDDTREKEATPILVSLTPRNEWTGNRVERRNDSYGRWYREVVDETGVAFLDLHNIIADWLDKKYGTKDGARSKERASVYFKNDHTHTSLLGARQNARCVATGLKHMHSPLAEFLRK